MSLLVDTHGTGNVDERKLEKILPEMFRLTPTNIRRTLKLNRPIYRRTAAYGHFGRAPEKDGGFSWEKTDLAAQPEEGVLARASGIRLREWPALPAICVWAHGSCLTMPHVERAACVSSAAARGIRCARVRPSCSVRCCRAWRLI